MKFVEANPLSDPETAARKLIEIANGVEALQDGRIHIEKNQRAVLVSTKRNGRPVSRRDQTRDSARLDRAARVRHLHPVHLGGRGVVCLKKCLNETARALLVSRDDQNHRLCELTSNR